MTKEFVYWRKSKMKQIPGNLIIDGDNIVFTHKDMDTYTGGYQMGGRRYMRSDEYASMKFNKFLSNLFKKIAKVKEDFAFSKSDIRNLSVTSMECPQLDPKTYRPIPGKIDYIAMANFSVNDETYELSFSGTPEDRSAEIEGLLK